jgi:AraC-like DNA-binding protein/mannose-6-phosphate isomerase-like protein (cupin superfamily)
MDISAFSEDLERIDVYNPKIRKNVAVNYHPRGGTSRHHTHDFYEINYVMEGRAINEIGGKILPMERGDGILLHPGAFHTVRAEKDATVLNILIRPQWLRAALSSAEEEPLRSFAEEAEGEEYRDYLIFYGAKGAREAVECLIAEATATKPQSKLAAEGAFLSLLAALCRRAERMELAASHDAGHRRFFAILAYAYKNANALTVKELADRFGYSPSHLSRLFRRFLCESPVSFLQKARLSRVASLLIESAAPVYSLAEECGFPCAPYFHRLFKRTYGMTPEEYRRAKGKAAHEEATPPSSFLQ